MNCSIRINTDADAGVLSDSVLSDGGQGNRTTYQ